ncbi:MAG: hypothetical protein Q7J98_01620 [Kiritimatiellia bacterium]|nr:hypothetical protein [Kiritimatiellia bacterium]
MSTRTYKSMKTFILISLAIQVLLQSAYAESWPKWKMSFYGDGWQVHDATDSDLIKTAENQKHDVGIFVSGKRFQGSIEDLFATLKSTPGIPDRDKYTLTEINGNKAIQLFSSMSQGSEKVKVWGLMFLRSNSIIALQGLYKDETGKTFLKRTMTSFKFVE